MKAILDHVGIAVGDLAASLSFYRDALGLEVEAPEEVERVVAIVTRLMSGVTWRDMVGLENSVGAEQILVVAPYNAQVAALGAALEGTGVRVGTVDKFQGREAEVVIYSMTSSTIADAPKGIGFLFDAHRWNVATSRARARIRSWTYWRGSPGTREKARLMSMNSRGSFISGPK